MSRDHLARLVDHVDLVKATEFALAAARYHYHSMKGVLQKAAEGPLDAPDFQKLINRFYYHFRGFFWELYASFDTLLQATNKRLELGIEPREVRWSDISAALGHRDVFTSLRDHLNGGYSADWFREVVEFRNLSHLGTIPTEAVAVGSDPPGGPKGEPTFAGLSIPGLGEPVSRCRIYGERMDEFVRKALDQLEHAASNARKDRP